MTYIYKQWDLNLIALSFQDIMTGIITIQPWSYKKYQVELNHRHFVHNKKSIHWNGTELKEGLI